MRSFRRRPPSVRSFYGTGVLRRAINVYRRRLPRAAAASDGLRAIDVRLVTDTGRRAAPPPEGREFRRRPIGEATLLLVENLAPARSRFLSRRRGERVLTTGTRERLRILSPARQGRVAAMSSLPKSRGAVPHTLMVVEPSFPSCLGHLLLHSLFLNSTAEFVIDT